MTPIARLTLCPHNNQWRKEFLEGEGCRGAAAEVAKSSLALPFGGRRLCERRPHCVGQIASP
jgi:hypothetical protein